MNHCGRTWDKKDLTDRVHVCTRPKGHDGCHACCCGATAVLPEVDVKAEEEFGWDEVLPLGMRPVPTVGE